MDLVRTKQLIKFHEGCVLHAYRDSLGNWTIGYGHLLDGNPGWDGYEISQIGADQLFEVDFERHIIELTESIPWIVLMDDVRQAVLYDMCFNLGVEPFDHDGFKDWPIFMGQVREGAYGEAAHNMRATLWAKQVKSRAERLAQMMETGLWPSL
jgi:lysozyme